MFQLLAEKREPWLVRARRNLKDYREGMLALAAFGAYFLLYLSLPLVLQPAFNGVWVKSSGDDRMPASMKVAIKRNSYTEDFVVPASEVAYEHLLLRVDSKEHPWTDDAYMPVWPVSSAEQNFPVRQRQYFYVAQLDRNDLLITRFHREDESPDRRGVETWRITVHGTQMTVVRDGRETSYRHASWFRSLFTDEP